MARIRVPLILAGTGGVLLAYRRSGSAAGTAASAVWSPFVVNVVNGLCLSLLVWRARVVRFRLSQLVGFRRSRLLRDVGWGVVSVVLYLMLVAFAVGYMLWGAGAGVIVRRQDRLAQVVVAHVISNLVPAAIPLVSLVLR